MFVDVYTYITYMCIDVHVGICIFIVRNGIALPGYRFLEQLTQKIPGALSSGIRSLEPSLAANGKEREIGKREIP